jgi:hypothetical protein
MRIAGDAIQPIQGDTALISSARFNHRDSVKWFRQVRRPAPAQYDNAKKIIERDLQA